MPELLGYIPTPCPTDPQYQHLLAVHVGGTGGTITTKMALGPDTPIQLCPRCTPSNLGYTEQWPPG